MTACSSLSDVSAPFAKGSTSDLNDLNMPPLSASSTGPQPTTIAATLHNPLPAQSAVSSSGGFFVNIGSAIGDAITRPLDDLLAYVDTPDKLTDAAKSGVFKALEREANRTTRLEEQYERPDIFRSADEYYIPNIQPMLPIGDDGNFGTFQFSSRVFGSEPVGINYNLLHPTNPVNVAFDFPSGSKLWHAIQDNDLNRYFSGIKIGFDWQLTHHDSLMFRCEQRQTEDHHGGAGSEFWFTLEVVLPIGGRGR